MEHLADSQYRIVFTRALSSEQGLCVLISVNTGLRRLSRQQDVGFAYLLEYTLVEIIGVYINPYSLFSIEKIR
jgi:hypothetical protein